MLNASYHQFLDDNAANGIWEQTYERRLKAPSETVLVIDEAGQIEGFASLRPKATAPAS